MQQGAGQGRLGHSSHVHYVPLLPLPQYLRMFLDALSVKLAEKKNQGSEQGQGESLRRS